MSIHWTLTLQCSHCYTVIRYEDERPTWQVPELGPVNEQLVQARAFVAEYPRLSPLQMSMDRRYHCLDGQSVELPSFVSYDLLSGTTSVDDDDLPDAFVTCPACDGAAFPIDAIAESVSEESTAGESE